MKIETERLNLRPISLEDKEALFSYRSDKITNQFQGWIPIKLEEASEFIQKISTTFNSPDSWFQFAIFEKNGGQMIGDLGVHFLEEGSKQAEIGCTLSKDFQGKGYAHESLKALMNSLFYDIDLHRIFASIDPQNIGSIKMMEKLGFRKEAHFKESLFLNGKWVDDVVYAILQNEWKNA